MSGFKIGDQVESEFFPDVHSITDTNGNAVKVAGQWLLSKQVELVRPGRNLKTEEPKLTTRVGDYITYIPKVGRKDDQDKPDLSLLPKEALDAMARAFMHGEKKYGRYNYRAGMDWHRPLAASLRHISAFNDGEDIDAESGISHLGHALAAVAMLIVYQSKSLGKDTRHKP